MHPNETVRKGLFNRNDGNPNNWLKVTLVGIGKINLFHATGKLRKCRGNISCVCSLDSRLGNR